MEVELGLKISRTLDDFSSAEVRISTDQASPLFISRETDAMFFLTAHLKGYKREHIKIDINEDGTQMTISGERPVQEMVMMNWIMYKKEPEMRVFRKAFNIPSGVNLDEIKARFNEDESVLTISMPKLVKGVRGSRVEEVKEEEITEKVLLEKEYRKPESENVKENDGEILSEEGKNAYAEEVKEEKITENELLEKECGKPESENVKEDENVSEIASEEGKKAYAKELSASGQEHKEAKDIIEYEILPAKSEMQRLESENSRQKSFVDQGQEVKKKDEISKEENCSEEKGRKGKQEGEGQERDKEKCEGEEARQSADKGSKLCIPIVAGSAFIVSIVAFVMHLIRTKNPPTRKKN